METTREERVVIRAIAKRAIEQIQALVVKGFCRIDIQNDLTLCHCNGTPLRLEALHTANDIDFAREILGLHCHLDRRRGQLVGYEPRFAQHGASRRAVA
jgi:hypothetical protein